MRGPIRCCAADAVGAVQAGSGGAGVLGFQGVDARGLDAEGDVPFRGVHAADEHAGDLGCDLVVCHSVGDFVI